MSFCVYFVHLILNEICEMKLKENNDFSIIIDFDKKSPNPSRVFKSMASLIESFEQFDKDLVKHIDNKIETVLILEDVEKGSLKTILANALRKVPDSAIGDLDYKKIIGHYLLKAKYIALNALEGKVRLTDATEIEVIEMELKKAANETGIDQIPTYVPTNKKTIIKNIDNINQSLEVLSDTDKVSYESQFGNASFNLDLKIDVESMEDLITEEELESNSKMILKVKKPDYLGDSKWSFKHGNGTISAKITHEDWLKDFQNRKIDVRPQDSLVCMVKITVKYDYNYEVISTTHDITEVIKINPRPSDDNQMSLI